MRKLFVLLLVSLMIGGSIQAQTSATCEPGLRTFNHVLGEICIPENVERVVALEWTYVEAMLALGMQPVGVADIAGYHNWVKIPVALDADVQDIGTRNEPNLELIAELEPDLIIGVYFRVTESYDDLSAIAPTLVFNPYPDDLNVSQYEEMTTTFTTIAEALNRVDEGEQVLAQMEATYDRAQTALEAAGRGGEDFILSQGWTTDSLATFRLFTDNAMAVQILEQIGLENAWDDAPQLYGFSEIGIEGFAALQDADFNFFYVAQDSDNTVFAESPLWSSLKFVQDERAYWMGGDVWLFGGPLSAELLVETILTHMGIELPAAEVAQAVTCEAGFRSIEHNLGSICIPENPQRIAAVDIDVVSLMRLLDVRPVAYDQSSYEAWLTSTPEWEGGEAFIEGAIDVGYPANVESLLQAQPDLIITNDADNYDQLNAVAPTVLFDIYATDSTNWADFTRYMADILNIREQAEALIAQTDARIAALNDYYQTEANAPVVSVVLYGEYGILSGAPYFAYNQIMNKAGILRPEVQSLDTEEFDAINEIYWATLSEEQLPLIDGDVLIMMLSQSPEELTYTEPLVSNIQAHPLWGALNAVQTNRFYTIPYQRWISFDPYSVNRIIDDLFQTIARVDAAEIAPNPFLTTAEA